MISIELHLLLLFFLSLALVMARFDCIPLFGINKKTEPSPDEHQERLPASPAVPRTAFLESGGQHASLPEGGVGERGGLVYPEPPGAPVGNREGVSVGLGWIMLCCAVVYCIVS